jgi:hypothetical protein
VVKDVLNPDINGPMFFDNTCHVFSLLFARGHAGIKSKKRLSGHPPRKETARLVFR